jgi:hypothetical protein
MTIKEFLRNIQAQNTRIRIIESQIKSLQGLAEYKTPVPDPIGGGHGTPDPHSRENLIAKLADMKTELTELKLIYLGDIERATKMILDIKDNKTLEVFSKRYLEFYTWEKIADSMGITFQWVHELHKRGLIELEKKYPEFRNGS